MTTVEDPSYKPDNPPEGAQEGHTIVVNFYVAGGTLGEVTVESSLTLSPVDPAVDGFGDVTNKSSITVPDEEDYTEPYTLQKDISRSDSLYFNYLTEDGNSDSILLTPSIGEIAPYIAINSAEATNPSSGTVKVSIDVENTGSSPAPESIYTVFDNNSYEKYVFVDEMQPGSSTTGTHEFTGVPNDSYTVTFDSTYEVVTDSVIVESLSPPSLSITSLSGSYNSP